MQKHEMAVLALLNHGPGATEACKDVRWQCMHCTTTSEALLRPAELSDGCLQVSKPSREVKRSCSHHMTMFETLRGPAQLSDSCLQSSKQDQRAQSARTVIRRGEAAEFQLCIWS